MTEEDALDTLFRWHDQKYPSAAIWKQKLQADIMQWHKDHTPTVSREAVEKLVGKLDCSTLGDGPGNSYKCQYSQDDCGRGWGGICPVHKQVVSDLLRLLTGEPRWCEHLKWIQGCGALGAYTGFAFYGNGQKPLVHDVEHWHICPICETLKPTP